MSRFGYLVDSHCHLNYEGLAEQQDDVIARAGTAGVGCMLAINTKLREFDEVRTIAERNPHIYASVGIHPHEAANEPGVAVAALIERSVHPKVVGLGETGLDYYYDNAPREAQQENFRAHMEAARRTGLPVIVHTRDADEDCAAMLRAEMDKGPFTGVIHCFTAGRALADAVLEMGFYISISGIVTFKNAADLREIVVDLPMDRLLVETDSPFLAPVPHRGKLCEPAYVADTARYIADLKNVSFDDLMEITSRNFFDLFKKAVPPAGKGREDTAAPVGTAQAGAA